jgi:hypothetical protein
MTVFRVGIVALVSVVGITPCSFGQGRIVKALQEGPRAAAAAKPHALTPIPGLQAGSVSALTGAAGPRSVSALTGKTSAGLTAGLAGHKHIVAALQSDKAALGQARPQRLHLIPGLDASVSRLKAPGPKALKSPAAPIDPTTLIKKTGK